MAIVFYAAKYSSALPVACALHELGVAHERVEVELGKPKSPEFLALNPNGKVPTLVVDGTPMFEAVAIVQWLGDRFGVQKGLWPAADSPARLTALSWTTWAYVTFGAQVMRFSHAHSDRSPAELRHKPTADHALGEIQQLLAILDAQLAKQPYLLGKDYSLVDLLLGNMLGYVKLVGVQLDAHSHIGPWLERVLARPAQRSEWG